MVHSCVHDVQWTDSVIECALGEFDRLCLDVPLFNISRFELKVFALRPVLRHSITRPNRGADNFG